MNAERPTAIDRGTDWLFATWPRRIIVVGLIFVFLAWMIIAYFTGFGVNQ